MSDCAEKRPAAGLSHKFRPLSPKLVTLSPNLKPLSHKDSRR